MELNFVFAQNVSTRFFRLETINQVEVAHLVFTMFAYVLPPFPN